MFMRLAGLVIFGLALTALSGSSAGDKDKPDKKDKVEKSDYLSITGVIRSVDAAKATFTISTKGNVRTVLVDESTKFVGAAGGSRGMGKAGLMDDTMVKGSLVRVLLAADNKAALEVHLPKRKESETVKDQ